MPEDQGRHQDGHDHRQAKSVAGDIEKAIMARAEHHQIGLIPDGGEAGLTGTKQHRISSAVGESRRDGASCTATGASSATDAALLITGSAGWCR